MALSPHQHAVTGSAVGVLQGADVDASDERGQDIKLGGEGGLGRALFD